LLELVSLVQNSPCGAEHSATNPPKQKKLGWGTLIMVAWATRRRWRG